ncbi:MAG: adenosine kinase [Pseudomonadota bacterium]
MSQDRYDMVAIGNAVVDVIARVPESFLVEHGVPRSTMTLIDTPRAQELYAAMPPATEASGGSAANTAVGGAQLGLRTAYIAKTRDDELGRIFAHDIRASGVLYNGPVAPASDPLETARSLICVTPDGERSMNTYLGISTTITPEDVDEALLEQTDWLYLEGYLFDMDAAKAAFQRAIAAVRRGGGKVALTCSDPFCIERHRADFRRLIGDHVDLLFANRAEALSLFETSSLEIACEMLGRQVELAAVTLSEEGALVRRGEREVRAAPPAVDIVDLTGAGDLFAAGFLAGHISGLEDQRAAYLGNLVAANIIAQIGPRSTSDLAALAAAQGFELVNRAA